MRSMADVCDLKAVVCDPLAFGCNDNSKNPHRKKTHRMELKAENQTQVLYGLHLGT